MNRQVIQLDDGDLGIDQTIAEMMRLALRDASDPIVQKVIGRFPQDRSAAARAAFQYVVETMPYVKDPGRRLFVNGRYTKVGPDQELVIAPRYTLGRTIVGGDCDDMATALVSLLTALGIRSAFKTIAWWTWDYTHVYVVMIHPVTSRVIPLDPVARSDGWNWEKSPIIRAKLYEVPMRELVTLEDDIRPCSCGMAGLAGCGCGRRRGSSQSDQNRNAINIIIGGQQGSNLIPGTSVPVIVPQRTILPPPAVYQAPPIYPQPVLGPSIPTPRPQRVRHVYPAFLGPPRRRTPSLVA